MDSESIRKPPEILPVKSLPDTDDRPLHPNLPKPPALLLMISPIRTGKSTIISNLLLNSNFFGQDYFMPMDGTHPSSGDYSCPTGAPYADVTDSVGNAAMCHNQGTMCGGTGGDHGGHAGGNHGGHASGNGYPNGQ